MLRSLSCLSMLCFGSLNVSLAVRRSLFLSSSESPWKKFLFKSIRPSFGISQGFKATATSPLATRSMTTFGNSSSVVAPVLMENSAEVELLPAVDDDHGGVIVEMKSPVDPLVFGSSLRASILNWRQQGIRGVWIKLPIELVNLVQPAVEEGFWYHHAEPSYLMLVYWIPSTAHTLPVNATHRVGVGAFVMNDKREVLVVQEKSGVLRGSGVWKFPTGVIDQGEDIFTGALREVKEETGIDTEFVEVLAFRQSHNAFFGKSDLFFVCILRPLSFDIQKQESEIEAAQWMPIEEYVEQPFVQKNELLKYISNVGLAKFDRGYTGFSPVYISSAFTGQQSCLYLNSRDLNQSSISGAMTQASKALREEDDQQQSVPDQKLVNLKYSEGGSVSKHLNKMKSIVNQLTSMNVTLDDELQALLLLSSFRDSWETLVVSLNNSTLDGTLSMTTVYSSLLNEETRKRASKSHQPQTYEARGQKSYQHDRKELRSASEDPNSKRFNCYYCDIEGHMKRNYRKYKRDLKDGKAEGENEGTSTMVTGDGMVVLFGWEQCLHTTNGEIEWVVDTWASFHATPRRDFFHTYMAEDHGMVKMGNSSTSTI